LGVAVAGAVGTTGALLAVGFALAVAVWAAAAVPLTAAVPSGVTWAAGVSVRVHPANNSIAATDANTVKQPAIGRADLRCAIFIARAIHCSSTSTTAKRICCTPFAAPIHKPQRPAAQGFTGHAA
jgi:hypothetical protein